MWFFEIKNSFDVVKLNKFFIRLWWDLFIRKRENSVLRKFYFLLGLFENQRRGLKNRLRKALKRVTKRRLIIKIK